MRNTNENKAWYETLPGVISLPLKRPVSNKKEIADEVTDIVMENYMVGIIQSAYVITKEIKRDSSLVVAI